MHLVLTGSEDVLVLYWHRYLYFSMDSLHVLRFDRTELSDAEIGDEDAEAAFEVVAELSERCVSVYSLK